jgi:hypothetical protein
MPAHDVGKRSLVLTATGAAVGLAGVAFLGTGLWGRRETRSALARERIELPGETGSASSVITASAVRSAAEFIRRNTLAATGDRTYAEVEPYLDAERKPTSDRALAALNERTGAPVENADHALWIQSTTLQAALQQAYIAFRLSELTVGLGAAFVAAGLGLTAAGRR